MIFLKQQKKIHKGIVVVNKKILKLKGFECIESPVIQHPQKKVSWPQY